MAGAILSLPSKWASERYFQSCTKYSVTEATALPRKQVETSCFGGTHFDPRRGSSIIWSLLSQKSCLKGDPIIYASASSTTSAFACIAGGPCAGNPRTRTDVSEKASDIALKLSGATRLLFSRMYTCVSLSAALRRRTSVRLSFGRGTSVTKSYTATK